MREITTHKHSDLNENINICVQDEPGPDGANHEYHAIVVNRLSNFNKRIEIVFQKGAVKDVGVNGISDEALLVIVRDRLAGFQGGSFACDETGSALEFIDMAVNSLKARTRDRISRGVEGVSKK